MTWSCQGDTRRAYILGREKQKGLASRRVLENLGKEGRRIARD